MRTCTTSTVWRLGSPRAFKAKLQAVMVHQAPSACFCGVGLHKDFVDSWNPQELEFSVSVLEDRDGSGNLFVRILLDCLICILGDREGRRENIGKSLQPVSTCFYDLSRLQSCCCAPCANVCNFVPDLSWLLFGIGNIRCLSGGIWLKKTSTLSDHFNRSTMAFGPEGEASWQVSREGIALSGRLWSSCGTFANFFDMFQRNVGSIQGGNGQSIWWAMQKLVAFQFAFRDFGHAWTVLNIPLNCEPCGNCRNQPEPENKLYVHESLSFIFLHASGDVGWCRMMQDNVGCQWNIV